MVQIKLSGKFSSLLLFLFMFSRLTYAQIPEQKDTLNSVKQDTTSTVKKSDEEKEKKKDAIILYTGINFNHLSISSHPYESTGGVGWQLGAAYKRGGFFYWQVGARFNSAKYNLHSTISTDTSHDSFTVTDIDIPITGGINFLSFVSGIANLRLFISAVPAFELSVSDNTLGILKDNTNAFNFYGQAGLGVDVLFLVVEAGYNYGFSDLLKDYQSNPGQVFINLGARF